MERVVVPMSARLILTVIGSFVPTFWALMVNCTSPEKADTALFSEPEEMSCAT